ncbi:lipoprotein [Streptomyces calidiresistens]|uniref:Lipoprotein n=1 Tax=Streptomyces calidiresistens TaxID=1485586 RepID=A0A7W3T7F7_9ACTN|nr:hypothetical protein [Streptomyces calidiresistens]MBB0232317.1 hypothetical protein [Streptomyces calidiresistens]
MANRLTRTAAAAALTGTLLLPLAACGDDGGADDTIEGAQGAEDTDTKDPAPEEEDPGTAPGDTIERPEISLPDDVTNIFEVVDTDDPTELAVLGDHEHRVNSLDEAIVSGDLERPAPGFYSSGDALRSAVGWIEPIIESGSSFTGTTRYYNRSVSLDGDTATVTYCVDASESFTTDRETGEVDPDSAAEEHIFYITRLERNEAGVWQTTQVATERGGSECD